MLRVINFCTVMVWHPIKHIKLITFPYEYHQHTSAFSCPCSFFIFSASLAFSARLFNIWLVGRHVPSVGTAARHCGHWCCVFTISVMHCLQKECPQRRVTGSVKIVRQIEQVKSSEKKADAMADVFPLCSARPTDLALFLTLAFTFLEKPHPCITHFRRCSQVVMVR